MTDETRIKRFFGADVTLADLADLPCDGETREKVRAVLAGEVDPCEVSEKCAAWVRSCYHKPRKGSHELVLAACDDLLGTCGVVSLEIEGDSHHTDGGIRMCPAFSYCNTGDSYAATLARDHVEGAWVVAGWADLAEERERDAELGDYEVFEECPERCPDCHGQGRADTMRLEFFPGSARGPAFSWVCDACNHHCFAETVGDSTNPGVKVGETEDGSDAIVRFTGVAFIVELDGEPFGGVTLGTAEDARQAFLSHLAGPVEGEDELVEGDGSDVERTTD